MITIPWMCFVAGVVGIIYSSMNKNGNPALVYVVAVLGINEQYQLWFMTLLLVMMPFFQAVFQDD